MNARSRCPIAECARKKAPSATSAGASKRRTRSIAAPSPATWFAWTVIRPGTRRCVWRELSFARGLVDPDRVEHRLDRAARGLRHAHLHHHVMHLRREPEIRVRPAVLAVDPPALGLDVAIRPGDRFVAIALDGVIQNTPRRDEIDGLLRGF